MPRTKNCMWTDDPHKPLEDKHGSAWITDEGVVIPVGFSQHYYYAKRYHDKEPVDLEEAGWVHVSITSKQEAFISFDLGAVTPAALRALVAHLKPRPILRWEAWPFSLDTAKFMLDTTDPREFTRFIRNLEKQRRKANEVENESRVLRELS